MPISYEKLGSIIRRSLSYKRKTPPLLQKADPIPGFKMVYFVGEKGLNYLNSSLLSVYKSFTNLPELIIVSDGTPIAKIADGMVKWPVKTAIISWEECAEYFKNKGDILLHQYATDDLWGKKMVAILYCAEKYKILYSDTDVLWFADPTASIDFSKQNTIKMCLDESFSYVEEMVAELGCEDIYETMPYNAGIIYANGDFSSHPKWNNLIGYLSQLKNKSVMKKGWTEQTAFAILNNYFGTYWTKDEMLLEINDHGNFFNKYKKQYSSMYARHYVTTKGWLFWRDYFYYFLLPFKNK